MTRFLILFAAIFILIFPMYASAGMTGDISGVVVGVHDGDTITVLTPEKNSIKIRLAEIDAPESKQPYGQKAKQALSDLVFEKEVKVEIQDVDRYGRIVGKVFQDDGYINASMVQSGDAWVYRQYSKDPELLDLEQEAKSRRSGLWALPEADQIPPWEWRHPSSVQPPTSTETTSSPIENSSCGTKRYCKQMSSCAEARHYLQNCGLSRLDGDNDGIPCEALCR